MDSYTVKLDVPGKIYPRFYIDLLRRSPEDPLPSQKTDDGRPPPILVEDDIGEVKEEYIVEKIIGTGTLRGRRIV